MTSICVHRAPRTPPDSTPGHISSRDVLQEARRPDTDLPRTALTALRALRARLVPSPPLFCNSSDKAIAILRASRAYLLARWFAGRTPTCHTRPSEPGPTLSCNSSGTAIAIPRASKAHPLARWFAGRSPEGHLTDTDQPHTAVRARLVPSPPLFCNSSDKAIAIPRASRAH